MLAKAKLNLMLQVTAKRADGYHLLQSLVMFARFGDEVSLSPADDFSLSVTGHLAHELPDTKNNLITRAAHALAAAHGITPHGRITLEKNLPIGAGMGGGSSDAAATLMLLSEYWGCSIPPALAPSLGSDIAACLHAKPCWMEGVGETITPLSLPFDVPVLLVNPRRHVATPQVYQSLPAIYDAPMALPDSFASLSELLAFLRTTRNALEPVAIGLEPVITDVLQALTALPQCGLARMSGSGATCFGIFPDDTACQTAQSALAKTHPNWWIQATTLEGSHG